MNKKLCAARVWDNGDMDVCGKPVAIADRCVGCRNHEVYDLKRRLKELDKERSTIERRLDQLALHACS